VLKLSKLLISNTVDSIDKDVMKCIFYEDCKVCNEDDEDSEDNEDNENNENNKEDSEDMNCKESS